MQGAQLGLVSEMRRKQEDEPRCRKRRKGQTVAAALPVLHGVGAMWYINLEFHGEAKHSIEYKRLLPFISADPNLIKQHLHVGGRPAP